MKTYNIASIAGDGIGKEVVPVAQKILKNQNQQKKRKRNNNSLIDLIFGCSLI